MAKKIVKAKKMVKKVMKKAVKMAVKPKKAAPKMKKASKKGYEKNEKDYIDQLSTDMPGRDEFDDARGLGDEDRRAKTEKKSLKVSYKEQGKSKKAARVRGNG